jgi:transcriptional regulator with XRE-family HTH domain
MDWSDYVSRHSEGRNQADVALLVGVSQSTVSRWKQPGAQSPSVENVMEFARAVGDSPVAGLIAAGYLRNDELEGVIRVGVGLGDATTDALLTELGRRLGLHVSVRKGVA